MKKLFLVPLLSVSSFLAAQNIGIGITNPAARLHVTDSAVLFSIAGEATIFPGNPPVSGAGRRMMWYPDKGAFRTGYIDGSQWDKNNIGYYSFASGFNVTANGGFSTALGGGSAANGAYSTAMGYTTIASGFGSAATGYRTVAKAYGAISFGALNDDTDNPDPFNAALSDRLFQIGNGDVNTLARNNALTVLRNGNTGIGTLTPGAKFHLTTGSSGYSNGYFPGAIIEGNSNTYLDFLTPDNMESAVLFGKASNAASGGVVYNNINNVDGLQFRTNGNTTRMVISSDGHVGIGGGEYNPLSSLDVARGTGTFGTAVFRGTTHLTHFNYHTAEHTYIRGGKDGSHVLINDMPALGNVGIGVSDPFFKLDVSQRMRIRSGGNNANSAGIWFNNNSNNLAAFIGMEDDTHIGIFGNNGAGWDLTMNTQTGALKINGSEGAAGQVLQSNGASSPSWINPLNALYNNMTEYAQSATVNMNNPGPGSAYPVPGLTNITLVISSVSKVIFSGGIHVQRDACGGCGSVSQFFQVSIASPFIPVAEGGIYLSPLEGAFLPTGMRFRTLNSGTYTINASIFNGSGSSGTATQGWLNIIVIPQ
ncbi:MAG: hypothetical protein JNK14_07930 [Chitinophagaceae bacterium]|nr:hypothetical protein [Chitinophagaceae bacterium]